MFVSISHDLWAQLASEEKAVVVQKIVQILMEEIQHERFQQRHWWSGGLANAGSVAASGSTVTT
jgi:hypothetical protein